MEQVVLFIFFANREAIIFLNPETAIALSIPHSVIEYVINTFILN